MIALDGTVISVRDNYIWWPFLKWRLNHNGTTFLSPKIYPHTTSIALDETVISEVKLNLAVLFKWPLNHFGTKYKTILNTI